MNVARALIIDDNTKNVTVLSRLLEHEGIHSIQITNPTKLDDALRQEERLLVIFLDLELPGINGYQILDRLKSDLRLRAVPVIAYTVHTSEIKVAYEHGFDGFLGKPLDSDRFPDQLVRILNGESVWENP